MLFFIFKFPFSLSKNSFFPIFEDYFDGEVSCSVEYTYVICEKAQRNSLKISNYMFHAGTSSDSNNGNCVEWFHCEHFPLITFRHNLTNWMKIRPKCCRRKAEIAMEGQFLVRQIYDDEITYNLVGAAVEVLSKFQISTRHELDGTLTIKF
jgi:hypothetical protein